MRTVPLLLLTGIFMTGCTSSNQKIDTSPWAAFGYEGMAGKINRLAGAESINCGIQNKLAPKKSSKDRMTIVQSKACIKAAIKTHTPFRYGNIWIPIDSYLFDALILTDTGEFWRVRYDSMIDNGDNIHDVERCKSVDIDYSTLMFNGVECTAISTEEWLSDIPEQQNN